METVPLDKGYFFRDFTAVGKVQGALPELVNDKTAQSFNPKRYNFYTQLINGLTNPNTKGIVDTVLTLESNNRVRQENIKNMSKEIAKSLAIVHRNNEQGFEHVRQHIDKSLQKDPTLQGAVRFAAAGGGDDDIPKSSYYTEMLNKLRPPAITAAKPEKVLEEYEYNATKSPDNEKITWTDRVVFIAVTFVIRGLALFVVQWALNSYMIKTFEQAFLLYVGTYLGIFILWVLLTNASDEVFLFRLLFYYISTTPHGYGRILVHILIQLLMVPIPSIVQNRQQGTPPFTFEQARKMHAAISRLSMFMWLFGVLVAINY